MHFKHYQGEMDTSFGIRIHVDLMIEFQINCDEKKSNKLKNNIKLEMKSFNPYIYQILNIAYFSNISSHSTQECGVAIK